MERDEIDNDIAKFFDESPEDRERMKEAADALFLFSRPSIIESRLSSVDDRLRTGLAKQSFIANFLRVYFFLRRSGEVPEIQEIYRYADEEVIEELTLLFNNSAPYYEEKGYRPSQTLIAMLIYFFTTTQTREDLRESGMDIRFSSGQYVELILQDLLNLGEEQIGVPPERTFHYVTFLKKVSQLISSPSEGFTLKFLEKINQIYKAYQDRKMQGALSTNRSTPHSQPQFPPSEEGRGGSKKAKRLRKSRNANKKAKKSRKSRKYKKAKKSKKSRKI